MPLAPQADQGTCCRQGQEFNKAVEAWSGHNFKEG
jgi:hypothetical protein